MEFACVIDSCGSAIGIVSQIDLYPCMKNLAIDSYVPDMKVERCQDEGSLQQLHYTDSTDQTLDLSESGAVVRYPWSLMRMGESLLYTAYPLMEVQRQRQGDLTAHSACVVLDQDAILLMGKEGSGKTTVAIDLCQRHSAKVIANDLCVIGEREGSILVRGGTKFFFLRRESIARSLPQLMAFFPGDRKKDSWLDKTMVNHLDLGIIAHNGSATVKRAYMLHVDETKNELNILPSDSLVTRLYLNENFSRYIRSTCTVMTGGANYEFLGYIPSLDCEQFFEMRKRLISTIISTGLQYVSGPVRLVADYIADFHRHG